MKGVFIIEDVQIEAGGVTGDLVLERFRVFGPDANVLVHTAEGVENFEIPKNLYFRGYLAGDPSSRAVVTVRENGGVRGLVLNGEQTLILSDETDVRGSGPMAMRSLGAEELDQNARPFACSSELIEGGQTLRQLLPSPPPLPTQALESGDEILSALSTSYALTLAIESDYEFYQLFGNTPDAVDYVADLISYVSTFYEEEIDTSLELGEISLWAVSADPWDETSTTCGLFEFGRTWNNTKSGVDRGLAHFMSGKNNGGGVAWLDVLCDSSFNYNHQGSCPGLTPQTSNYGGAYGYSGTLDGDFDINNPSVLWDIVVVAHEIGHNFGSPHTHCYGGIGGNANAVDSCYTGECGNSGCACGSSSLPSSCPGSGQGCGTIMSYCHLLSGGLSNISMTFGQDHPYGLEPERVADRMSSRVQSTAATYPVCLAPSNTAPSATADSYSVDEDTTLTVDAPGVLDNDSDAEADDLTAVLDSPPSDGDLALSSDGSFTYTPDPGFWGSDSFRYVASDGSETSSSTLVSITVEHTNTAPTATADSYSVGEDLTLTVNLPGVLENDADVDGDALTALLRVEPSDGELSLSSDGSFTYTPDPGFSGSDFFRYVANDGAENSNRVRVSITVVPCPEVDDVTLDSTTISSTASYEACTSLTAGPSVSVTAAGDLTLSAATVILVDGFSVAEGGELTVLSR